MRSCIVCVALLVSTGCLSNRRDKVNAQFLVGGYAAAGRSSYGLDGSVGGGTLKAEAAGTDDDVHFTAWGRADVAVGGNVSGLAGQFSAESEFGLVALRKAQHNLFARGGGGIDYQRDPYQGFLSVEFPTATFGYQFHGDGESGGYSDSLHVDLGVRGGLVDFMRSYARRREADNVGIPEIGPTALFMGEVLKMRASYMTVFDREITHVWRTSLCVEYGAAVCLDTREVSTVFITRNGPERIQTDYIGVSFGFGFVTGNRID